MRRLFVLSAALIATAALAQTLSSSLSWNAVTTNTDDTVPASITYNVYEGPTATGPLSSIVTGLTTLTEATSVGASGGAQACFAVTATNDEGVESAPSATVCKTFPKSTPSAPTGLVVK